MWEVDFNIKLSLNKKKLCGTASAKYRSIFNENKDLNMKGKQG